MYVYKISELLESLKSAQKEGFEYVSISIVEPDHTEEDSDYESCFLDYVIDASGSETDIIDSVTLPKGYYYDE